MSFVHFREPALLVLFFSPPPLSPFHSLCNRSSPAHFKPKHVCLALKQTGPPLSPLFSPLPLPQQTPFPIQRDDVMPMLKKTSGLKMRCVCVCVWVEASRGMMGSWEWVVMLSDYRLKFPMVISQRLTESMRVRESSLLLLFVSLLAFLLHCDLFKTLRASETSFCS